MAMIRRFFIYVISIITVVLVTYGYVYWGDLFGENTPIGYMISASSKEGKIPAIKKEGNDEQSSQVGVAETESVQEAGAVDEAIQPDTDVVLTEAPAASNDVVVGSADEPVSKSELPAEIPINDLWEQARNSFKYRDYKTSVVNYQQLIARTQDNFDAYEELGDVYVYYGKKKEAAAAYYEAASILVRLGKIDRAASFMEPLSLMDTTKAKALLALIEAASK